MSENIANEEGLKAARAFAQWHLGYPSWGDSIVDAYLNPERTMRVLKEETAND